MTKGELIDLMRGPVLDSGDNLQWTGYEWTFNAKLDLAGRVYNLQWHDATAPQSGELPCSWLRVSKG